MNPKLVRQAKEYAVKLCAKFNDRIVITINGTGGMGNSTEIRPYCNEGFSYDPDLEAIIVKKKKEELSLTRIVLKRFIVINKKFSRYG